MDSQHRLQIDTYESWPVLPYDLGHPDPTDAASTGLGPVVDMYSDTSTVLTYGDFVPFDPDKMEKFLIDVVESNHERSTPSSSAVFHGRMDPSGTLTPIAKRGPKTASDRGSPLPDMMMDISGERRRAQNRAAQRAHRERQKRYVAQLEKRFFALQANYNHLDEKYKAVQREYEALISFVQSQQTPVDSPLLRTSAEPVLAFSSPDLQPLSEFSLCEQELDRVLAFRVDETPSPKLRGP
ncbi:hypothetical protein PV04_03043 [Phialophora macrospora]|uniref:Putative transcription factor kapC n=1 Tax=Phialophora macrospora TaxID=1851006 RepID=A0A0D2FWE1_9EURO|nr:hypothetical protein PV04_03043 [Phialophora macrospora]